MKSKRILIFVVAYNHEQFIENVLSRIPLELSKYDTEILIIDDASQDHTFEAATRYKQEKNLPFKFTVLVNPNNQRYGGNQKLGFHYAIENRFDILALVHGDGQYAPEALPVLLEPIINEKADLVMGSRMATKLGALKGGMPLYKFVGNKVLTFYQNLVLGTDLYEFHTGYRLYSVEAIKKLPFDLVTNGFHFDNEIFLQIHFSGRRVVEIPIDSHYGDEVCNVDGFRYAWDIFKTTTIGALQKTSIFYRRKFDVTQKIDSLAQHQESKLGFPSSHSYTIDAIPEHSQVLNFGSSGIFVAQELKNKGCRVDGIAFVPKIKNMPFDSYQQIKQQGPYLPESLDQYDTILILESLETFNEPEVFVEEIAKKIRVSPEKQLVIIAANVVFIINRLLVLFGWFNYGKRGILNQASRQFFTINSLRNLFDSRGFTIEHVTGIPAPFPLIFGENSFSRFLITINKLMILASKSLFAYQIMFKARPQPSLPWLLEQTRKATSRREEQTNKNITQNPG